MLDLVIPPDVQAALAWADLAALALLVATWGLMGWITEHPFESRPSVTVMMSHVRREWMREYLHRENRIFDAQIVASLRQGTAFMASTSILAVGGVLALIGNVDPLAGLAAEVGREEVSRLQWQIRLVPAALFLTHAFLKFIWSNRLFGYCSVMMAAVPSEALDPRAEARARRAGELNVRAAYNFNRGLRSLYWALASLAWIAGPLALGAAALVVTVALWRREFASVPRDILSNDGAGTSPGPGGSDGSTPEDSR